jgi:hypothetical protein
MPRQPAYNFTTRITPETDERRRRIQRALQCPTPALVSKALEALEINLTSELSEGERVRYFQSTTNAA